jgi:hypothetical protein
MRITVALVVCIWIFVGMLIGVGHASNQDPSRPYMAPVPVSLLLDCKFRLSNCISIGVGWMRVMRPPYGGWLLNICGYGSRCSSLVYSTFHFICG